MMYSCSKNGKTIHYRVRPRTILTSAPLFTFSDRPRNTFSRQTMLVSIPMYVKFTNLVSVRQLKFQRLIIKMKDGLTPNDQNKLVEKMKNELAPASKNNC